MGTPQTLGRINGLNTVPLTMNDLNRSVYQYSFTPKLNQAKQSFDAGVSRRTSAGNNLNLSGLASAAPGIISTGLQAYGDISNSFGSVKDVSQLMAESGSTNAQTDGIGWERVNSINTAQQMSELRAENHSNTLKSAASGAQIGSTIGSVAGPVGTAVGAVVGGIGGAIAGLFGSKSRKRKLKQKMYEAQQAVNRTNQFNQSSAMSEGLALNYYSQYGDTTDDILYANKGKDLIQPKYGKKK